MYIVKVHDAPEASKDIRIFEEDVPVPALPVARVRKIAPTSPIEDIDQPLSGSLGALGTPPASRCAWTS